MSRCATGRASILAVTAFFFVAPSFAVDEISPAKDLTAVIALQGLPCGQVVSATRKGDNDYIASCHDGHRYRVYVNADGRLIVQKQ